MKFLIKKFFYFLCLSITACSQPGSQISDDFLGGVLRPPSSLTDGNITTSTTSSPALSWTASPSNSSSTFGGYEIALGTTPGGTDVLTWTDVGNVTSYTPNVGFTLTDGLVYYATVRAYNTTGLKSTAINGDGFTVNSNTAVFNCDFINANSTDCEANPWSSISRPLVRFYRAGGANTSPGTYVDSSGTIQVSPTNLVTHSQDFTNWAKTRLQAFGAGSVADSNATTAPDGTNTAEYLVEDSTAGAHYAYKVLIQPANQQYTYSVYVKAGTRTAVQLWLISGGTANGLYGNFNLATGEVTSTRMAGVASGVSASIISVGNGWYRCLLSGVPDTVVGASVRPVLGLLEDSSNTWGTYAGDGTSGLYAWGAQVEVGSTATNFIYTNATTNYGPRLDHSPSDCSSGVCSRKGLLIEEARTNYSLHSAQHSNWSTTRSTITANAITAPDGTLSASKLVEDATAMNSHFLSQASITVPANQTWTFSAYFKAAERNLVVLNLQNVAGTDSFAYEFNLANGTSTLRTVSGTGTSVSSSIISVGNGWYRCSATGTIDAASTTLSPQIFLESVSGSFTYSGDGVSGIYIWGTQVESGSFPTSYIPTTTVALTRNADNTHALGTTPWYNNAAGTLLAQFLLPSSLPTTSASSMASLGDGTLNNRMSISNGADCCGMFAALTVKTGGSTILSQATPSYSIHLDTNSLIGFSYSTSDFVGVSNGTIFGETTSANNVPSVTQLTLGADTNGTGHLNGWLKTLQYYNLRLNNDQLKFLTTP